MKALLRSVFLAFVLMLAQAVPAGAGPFEDGLAAAQRGDFAAALKFWRPLAKQGDATAQYLLGIMYYNGEGVPQDYAEAVKWYRRAAEQGFGEAQYNLGLIYYSGEVVPQDYAEAVKWYRRAAEQGLPKAKYNLGNMYENGEGVPQDYAEAVTWYRKAAEQGFAYAQHNLGVMYREGQGVPQDDAEAVKWYRLAAEQGDAWAQHNLGIMYLDGYGVSQDDAQALRWFRLAADQGLAEARKMVREWEKRHTGFLPAIDFEPASDFVVIDQSNSAYTVYRGIPKESSKQELEEIKSNISEQKGAIMLKWAKFIENANKYVNSTIIKHEYMNYNVADGIVCLVGKIPKTPWALTWNGGIALTHNDYKHAEETYQLYQEDPEKYEQTVNRDPRADPINPGGHLPAFGCD